VAVALHLTLLTTFAWSLAATHHVYALIVEVGNALNLALKRVDN
jgi:hypothetical protein